MVADITSLCTFKKAVVGELTFLEIITSSAAATADTIDLNIDQTDAVDTYGITVICTTRGQNTTGTEVADWTWSNTTGVITVPTISTGVHKILVVGY